MNLSPALGLSRPAGTAGPIGKVLGVMHAGGDVPKTGAYKLKKGEKVIPAAKGRDSEYRRTYLARQGGKKTRYRKTFKSRKKK
jgi:hypothetical protein